MRTFDTQKLSDALERRRKGLREPGKNGLSGPQIDAACSLFVAAERLQNLTKTRVTEREVEDILDDYFRKYGSGDYGAQAVVDTVKKFMEEQA